MSHYRTVVVLSVRVWPQIHFPLLYFPSNLCAESTIITHGMPYPTNLSMAREVETILATQGVTPATIALFNGKVHVGKALLSSILVLPIFLARMLKHHSATCGNLNQ